MIKRKIYALLKHNGINLTLYIEEYKKTQGQKSLFKEFAKIEKINIWTAYNCITNVLMHKHGRVDVPRIMNSSRKPAGCSFTPYLS